MPQYGRGGGKKALIGVHPPYIVPKIANFLENLKKICSHSNFFYKTYTHEANSNSTITFFNISSDSFYFPPFFKKSLQIWTFLVTLTHTYSNCPIRLKFAPLFSFCSPCFCRMPTNIFYLRLNLICFILKCFINTTNFQIYSPI